MVSTLAGCHLTHPQSPDFKHQNDQLFDAQTQKLAADDVRLSTEVFTANDSTRRYLSLLILNPTNLPTPPDSLNLCLKNLARLLVADLRNPRDYDAVTVRVQTDRNYLLASTSEARNFEYPLAELQ
ncbi:hypothetical protein GCM10027345_28220 [Hymenobacter daeguensis]